MHINFGASMAALAAALFGDPASQGLGNLAIPTPKNGGPAGPWMPRGTRGIGKSKYMPHQGPRECARRRRQMEKAHGKANG